MAAQNGSMTLTARSGRTYIVDVYSPDAAGTLLTFSSTSAGASTSPSQFRIPEDCILTDLSFAASPTATAVALNVNNATIQGGVIRYANVLNTLPYRVPMRIPLKGGDFIGGLNLA